MKNKNLQIVVTIIFVTLLVLLLDPFMVFMTPMLANAVLVGVVALLAVWSGMILNEESGDEREMQHRDIAGRLAYFSGILCLTLALVYQGVQKDIDVFIVVTLAVMVITKMYSRWYFEKCC